MKSNKNFLSGPNLIRAQAVLLIFCINYNFITSYLGLTAKAIPLGIQIIVFLASTIIFINKKPQFLGSWKIRLFLFAVFIAFLKGIENEAKKIFLIDDITSILYLCFGFVLGQVVSTSKNTCRFNAFMFATTYLIACLLDLFFSGNTIFGLKNSDLNKLFFFAAAVLPGIYLLTNKEMLPKKYRTTMLILLAAIFLHELLISLSRANVLATLLAVLGIVLLESKKKSFGVILLLCICGASFMVGSILRRGPWAVRENEYDASNQIRIEELTEAIFVQTQNIFFGDGLGSFVTTYLGEEDRLTHIGFGSLFLKTGLFGFAVAGLLSVCYLTKTLRDWIKMKNYYSSSFLAFFPSFIFFLVIFLTSKGLMQYQLLGFGIVLGMTAAHRKILQKNRLRSFSPNPHAPFSV